MGLPGGEPLLDNLPILQKLNDGPISRILKTVDQQSPLSPTPTPQDDAANIDDNDGLEVEAEPSATTGQSINLTIREIRFRDPPKNEGTQGNAQPSDTNDAKSNNTATQDQVVITARDEIQDTAAVELNLASCDTNIQVPDRSSNIDALTAGFVVATNDEVAADLCTLRHEYDQSPGQVSAVAEGESQLQWRREQENEDEVATLIAEDCRRSNDLLQQAVAATAITYSEETIDGLIGNDQLEQVQQAFEVELVEARERIAKNENRRAESQRVHTLIENDSASVSVANSEVKEDTVTVVATQTEVVLEKDQEDEVEGLQNVLEKAAVEPTIKTTDCIGSESVEDVVVNYEDISVAVVFAANEAKETLPADECLKIINESVICRSNRSSDLVTRIASYYSTQDEDEGSEDEQISRPPVPLKTYQWEDIRRAKQQVCILHCDRRF